MGASAPPPRLTIRRAGPGDAEAIARLHIASWRASYADVLPAAYLANVDPAVRSRQWRAAIERPEVAVLVATDSLGVAGFAAGGPCRDGDLAADQWYQLYNFHVAPDRRGSGIGTLLWRRLIADQPGAREALTLWVVPANLGARRFYERQGLEPDGTTRTELVAPEVHLPEMRYRTPIRR